MWIQFWHSQGANWALSGIWVLGPPSCVAILTALGEWRDVRVLVTLERHFACFLVAVAPAQLHILALLEREVEFEQVVLFVLKTVLHHGILLLYSSSACFDPARVVFVC